MLHRSNLLCPFTRRHQASLQGPGSKHVFKEVAMSAGWGDTCTAMFTYDHQTQVSSYGVRLPLSHQSIDTSKKMVYIMAAIPNSLHTAAS